MPDIEQLFEQLQGFKLPPVKRWQPCESLDINLRIAADGRWYHEDSPIERERLVKLFGSVLRLDADGYYLVTPNMKYPVVVEDVPFQAVEVRQQGSGVEQELVFRTNVDDVVLSDREHPICVKTDLDSSEPSPYVEVRDGLQAKICRSVYYELVEMLRLEEGDVSNGKVFGVYSAGEFFPFGEIL